MTTPPRRPASPLISRMLVHIAGSLLLVAGAFLAYMALALENLPALDRGRLLTVYLATLLAAAALLQGFSFVYLGPLRRALSELDAGRPAPEPLVSVALRRLQSFPAAGALATAVLWAVGTWIVAIPMRALALQSASLRAGVLAALCMGLFSALVKYHLALATMLRVRPALPGALCSAGLSIGWRLLLANGTLLLAGLSLVGAGALVRHQNALVDASYAHCRRSIEALLATEPAVAVLVRGVQTACRGPAAVFAEGSLQAGDADARPLLEGAAGPGRLLVQRLARGAELRVRVGARAEEAAEGFASNMVLLVALALLLAIAVALLVARSIIRPVRTLVAGADAIARGDLTREVPALADDELGSLAHSFAEMTRNLRRVIGRISGEADELAREATVVAKAGAVVREGVEARGGGVSLATREMTDMDRSVAGVGRDVSGLSAYVASTSEALARFAGALDEVRRHGAELERAVAGSRVEVHSLLGAAESMQAEAGALARAARDTLATVGESTRSIRALTDAAVETERVAQRLSEETVEGMRVVEEGVRGVEAIRGVVAEAKARVEALGARSADITVVVDFIADVAKRTNLLSLNAAIIAAQAGEQGKPFGVVADQIRELAAQIGSSTKRIADIIAGVRVEVEATSSLIQQSDELAAAGVERAREGGRALRNIAEQAAHGRRVAASITPAVVAHADVTRQTEGFAAHVVDMAEGFAGVDLLVRGGRSIEALAQSLTPLTQKVGRALEEQAAVGRRQVESLEEINQMIARLNRTVAQHGDGTARALQSLAALLRQAEEDRRVAGELSGAAEALAAHVANLREGLGSFRT